MCAVSAIMGEWVNPASPNFISMPTIQNDPALAGQMLKVLDRLEAIDKRLGLLEQCKFEKEQKEAFKKKLRRASRKKPRATA